VIWLGYEAVNRVVRIGVSRVTRNSIPGEEDVNSLSRALGMELPMGYREYVTSFGPGTMCTFLVVKMPSQIRNPERRDEEFYRDVFAFAGEYASDPGNVAGLDSTEFEHATVLAYANAEAPIWFATRTRGARLFEHVEGGTFEIENGFFGLVERCAAGQRHEFPFFEPKNGGRRMRQLYVRPGVGRTGFVEAMARRWGSDNLRCSRTSKEEYYPHYFVPAIEGHIVLHHRRASKRTLPSAAEAASSVRFAHLPPCFFRMPFAQAAGSHGFNNILRPGLTALGGRDLLPLSRFESRNCACAFARVLNAQGSAKYSARSR
jgi:hypothetical protein